AQLLGRSRKILEILNTRQLPNIDVDSMADIGKWHALPKSEIPNGAPLNQSQLAFPSPNESVIVNIGVLKLIVHVLKGCLDVGIKLDGSSDDQCSGQSDKCSVEYQRIAWYALQKSINGLANKVNGENIRNIIPELFSGNLIWVRDYFINPAASSPKWLHLVSRML
ncbi:Rho guanyl-nucleotide exchange factor 12, partial [Tanacetum coccineum]